MEQSITIKNLCKSYGQTQILKDISFEAKAGRVTAFLGPNGAGKSSTLRILLGLDKATSGLTKIGDQTYKELKFPLKTVGASFDSVGAPDDRTVYQHLKIVAASNGISSQRIEQVLDMVDISYKKKSKIGKLSLGEGQRLGIATALLGNPQYLILDEPTNGLDPRGIRWFREFIKKQAQEGKTVLLSSHILSEVEAVTDDVVIINKGKVLIKGTLQEVMKNLSSLEEVFFSLTEGGK
ncbi:MULTISPECIES: ABC transporter ATP-binding protein [Streptococcus]|uniref:ABC transporter ATP-binding protein n=1 Tax=Streptococcus TaxID=1301 RepID=UPI00066E23C8|nr:MULTISPECIES: ATP-binding cassette domain-containing protein [Streptococcus]BBP09058.1 ABC transporter ATP-binding protein [Streptococcus sp. 116-D4]